MYKIPAEGLSFILIGLASACITDVVSQLLLLIVISATQFACEVRGRKLPFDTNKLRRMTKQANEVSKKVFQGYQEQSALLKFDCEGEEELLKLDSINHFSPHNNITVDSGK